MPTNSERSSVLPHDPFDIRLAELIGRPNGGHVPATVTQDIDHYGNITQFIVQTVRDEQGATVFVTQINASGSSRYILPPKVLALLDRQRDTITAQIRRRHGKRLAAERGAANPFTPEMREKALQTRKRNAAKRAKRKGGRA